MNRSFASRSLARLAISGLVTGGLAAAALGLGAGTASAGGPYTWCPGMSMAGTNMDTHTGGPGLGVDWDMTVCHKWWAVNVGMGNVSRNIWEGDPPQPPEAFEPVQCPPIAFMCP
jgi:hypothetical protein